MQIKYFYLFIFAAIFGFRGISQQIIPIDLNWKYETLTINPESEPINIISFDGANLLENRLFLPEFVYRLPLHYQEVSQVEIVNKVLKPLPQNNFKDQQIETNITPLVSYAKAGAQDFAIFHFIPIRFNEETEQFERLVSFDIKVTTVKKLSKSISKRSAENSVLENGDWYKLGIRKSGIYKIDYSMLVEMGLNPDQIDPRKIKIFGNGGGMLPQPNKSFRNDDLVENSIAVRGEEDGKFNTNDYVLFYAQGPHIWEWNDNKQKFDHVVNDYSDKAYYFLTIGQDNGKRISEQASNTDAVDLTLNQGNCYAFHEVSMKTDVTAYTKSGRDWFGETFDVNVSQDFDFEMPNLIIDDSLLVESYVAGRSGKGTSSNYFLVQGNGKIIKQGIGATNISNYLDNYCRINISEFMYKPEGAKFVLNYTYSKPTSTSKGWLNYIEINGKCSLAYPSEAFAFRNKESRNGQNIEYYFDVNGQTSLNIWDVSDPLDVKKQQYKLESGKAVFRKQSNQIDEFISFKDIDALKPAFEQKIENQNLHAIKDVDMIIVAHPEFIDAAKDLSDFHLKKDSMVCAIVTPQQIYNEFSSGAQDVTAIRDFVKMVYENSGKPVSRLKYLLLFGDASYDYKDVLPANTNYVPTFQSRDVYFTTGVYATDDYFGFLDEDEGEFDNVNAGQYKFIDIAIGRLPVDTKEQAQEMVDKIKQYQSSKAFGDWRNKIVFVSDDTDDNGFNDHIMQSERLYDVINKNYKDLNFRKIYMDAFLQESTPNGPKYPSANQALNDQINSGALLVNYIGHGGEAGWAHERVLEVSDVKSWKNAPNFPLFVTATCEFSRYDDPERVSAGEWVLLNTDGGSIAMLTTSRVVYVSSNNDLTNKLYTNNIFEPYMNGPKSFGEIIIETKNKATFHTNTRKFVLLGDPSLRLAYPKYNVVATEVPDTFKAFSVAEIKGEVQDLDGLKMADFNGQVDMTIYDRAIEEQTLQNDPLSPLIKFETQNNVIYKGKASVNNGEFTFRFVVPKDISYVNKNGKISFYAHNDLTDANGYFDGFIIGGTENDLKPDTSGPIVKLFIGDSFFVSGGICDENPLLFATMWDQNGINTTGSGIGHEIMATLDNHTLINLNSYYQSALNSYQQGEVKYRLQNLSDGTHYLKIKVWDVLNNSAEDSIRFVVKSSDNFEISSFDAFPNPASNEVHFRFKHNQSDQDISTVITVFDARGQEVHGFKHYSFSEGNTLQNVSWNLRDNNGDKLEPGLYLVQLLAKNENDIQTISTTKLLILDR